MTLTSATVFDDGLSFFDGVVAQIQPGDWDKPSPCAGWTALDVLGHLSTALNMGASLLNGEQPTWPEFDRPADLVEGDPAEYYRAAAQRCREALVGADLELEMDTPMGKRTVADRLAFPAIDLYVHGWDVAEAAGIQVEIPQDVIDFTHAYIDPFPADVVRGANGAFGPEADVAPHASPTEAFLAWTGRTPL
ncbi:TIGR03086 family metal-binding protein [Aquihabitans sp. McL0605]|uniref:TIGR03086 family metal-binding protein n=1 Tax=Aquihabitans sp. McL0605 TaxID=3415671 RepID=UPI003CFB889F